MVNKPKAIGTAAETAATRAVQRNGFPHAERRALRGIQDAGDITGTPGVCWEVKGGQAAKAAGDGQVAQWLAETERERVAARADFGVLVLQRAGIGPANAERWWAVLDIGTVSGPLYVRMHLADACRYLRQLGYGQPLEVAEQVSA